MKCVTPDIPNIRNSNNMSVLSAGCIGPIHCLLLCMCIRICTLVYIYIYIYSPIVLLSSLCM